MFFYKIDYFLLDFKMDFLLKTGHYGLISIKTGHDGRFRQTFDKKYQNFGGFFKKQICRWGTWIIFRLVKSWNKIFEIAVLNCADEKNSPICREHEIDAFPTLKVYIQYR